MSIIIIVYLPILSLRGVEGKMFRPMAFTVIFALLTSLAALTLMPVLASLALRRGVSEEGDFRHTLGQANLPAALAARH